MKTARRVAVVFWALLCPSFVSAEANAKSKPAVVPPNRDKVPTQAEYLALVRNIQDDFLIGLRKEQRASVEAILERQGSKPRQLASGAAVLAAFGKPDGILLAARAAEKKPDDPIIANTLGGALNLAKHNQQALSVLLYARSLAPDSYPILTNLAVVHMDTGRDSEAFMLLTRATGLAPKACPPWAALAIYYARRGDAARGVQAYLHTAACSGFSKLVKEKAKISREPPPSPIKAPGEEKQSENGSASSGSGQGKASSGSGQGGASPALFRPFPQWARWEDLLASQDSLKQWKKSLDQEFGPDRRSNAGGQAGPPSGPSAPGKEMRPINNYDDARWALEMNIRYYEKKLKDVDNERSATVEKSDGALKSKVQGDFPKMKQAVDVATRDPAQAAAKKEEYCKAVRNSLAANFTEWRNAEEKAYNDKVKLLIEYLNVTGAWIERVADPAQRAQLDWMRRLTVWSYLAPLPSYAGTRGATYGLHMFTSLGECGTKPQPPLVLSSPPPAALPTPNHKCPIPEGSSLGGGMEIGTIGDLKLTFDCTSIQAEGQLELAPGLGFSARGGYNSTKHELVLAGGTYAETPIPGAKLGWTTEIETTIRNDGVNVAMVTGPEAEVGKGVIAKFENKMTFTIIGTPEE